MANRKDNKKEIEQKSKSKKTNVNTSKNSNKKTTKDSKVKSEVKKDIKSTPKKVVKVETKKEVKPTSKKIREEKKELKIKEVVVEENKKEESFFEPTVNNNKVLIAFEKIIILVAVAFVFSLIGYLIGINHETKKDYTEDIADLEVFIEQYNKVVNEYYVDADKDSLIKGAITGMLSVLDGYTGVIDDTSNSFSINLEGEYEGVGIEIINDNNGNVVIYNVYDDTPAKKAGLKVDDIIMEINGTDLSGVTTMSFVDMIAEADDIELLVKRGSKELTIKLKKEKIVLKSVTSEMLDNNVGYIKVDIFANNTYNQFKEQLESLEKKKMKSLIIDLRDNSGGHLTAAKDILALFLDSSHPIYQTESRTEKNTFYSEGIKDKSYKIVILQNEVSASASEIVASALNEQLDAYIIGKTSYGKGTVQQLETVEGIAQYKFTTKKWLTSKGTWIDGNGIKPNLEVNQSNDYYSNPTKKNDTQLQEAIKYLNKK